ncbi:endonuclease IV [Bacillus canaveralius]|uniref:Endonuclease IV n=1 Tax=Bacillus canaveralius TaxID=1403243 RepID=A0A2N5GGL7_9BACI|nr:deoxyribonuclease IV [Bacillus canaveralius]PLR79904.1 endonuclease IV [Bacillus canaveralius]PLR96007.1 endonuclease IV [Bacillus canaveralius]RSK51625.1 deoxyribonuclease IV [Bacillus canaveralius]
MKFGCHVSIRHGYLEAAKHAAAIEAAAFQYFPKNPRSLSVKDFNKIDAKLCQEFCQEHKLESVAHTPYPTSLTPENDEKKEKVIMSLLNDLEIADSCGSIGVVVHFGGRVSDKDPLASYQLMISILNEILAKWEGDCLILLENNAGKAGAIGTTLEEIVQVRNLVDFPEKIGFCLDTCHAFASDLWNGENHPEFIENGKELGYLKNLRVIHFNNSKYPAGSGKDRHANIFKNGHISEDHFDQLIKTPLLKKIPFILETPKDANFTHKDEIKLLKKKWV